MKRPWMPLHVPDYFADTRHLNTEQHGAYLLLIMHYWQAEELPNDDALLAQIAGVSAKKWVSLKSVLSPLFQQGWKHKRVEAEIAKAIDIIEKRKKAGAEGANRRHGKSVANARSLPPQEPTPKPTPLPRLESNSVPNGTGSKAESLSSQRRKNPEDMTQDERDKLALFERGGKMGISGSLIGRLYNAYGGDKAMAAATRMSSKVLNAIESGQVRDKRSYIGAVISKLGKEDAAHLESWDTSL